MQIKKILENHKIITTKDSKKVQIGSLVLVKTEDEKEILYEIRSYVTYIENTRNKKAKQTSYISPIGSCLTNKKVGSSCVLKIGKNKKKLFILKIENFI